ncbi:DUF6531 domain-containing protein, partial [Methyloversatilis sp. XJ19-13]|uniref:DUF6531 domain-containing protein n=1 Tax=Methyloversatilis sp. XJ19-13 TaxID=2963430 RepID=UPI00211BF952
MRKKLFSYSIFLIGLWGYHISAFPQSISTAPQKVYLAPNIAWLSSLKEAADVSLADWCRAVSFDCSPEGDTEFYAEWAQSWWWRRDFTYRSIFSPTIVSNGSIGSYVQWMCPDGGVGGYRNCSNTNNLATQAKNLGQGSDGCDFSNPMNNGTNPINTGTGNKFQHEIGDAYFDFGWSYNSQAVLNAIVGRSTLGNGWRHSFDWRLRFDQGVGVYSAAMVGGSGEIYFFNQFGTGWISDSSSRVRLENDSLFSGVRFFSSDNFVLIFDGNSRLRQKIGHNGARIDFHHELDSSQGGDGEVETLDQIIDNFGRGINFLYNSDGYVSRVEKTGGELWQYSYGGTGNLVSVIHVDGEQRTYIYDETANASGVTGRSLLTGILDENSQRYSTYKYLSNRRAFSSKRGAASFDISYLSDGDAVVTDPLGTSRTYSYQIIQGRVKVGGVSQPGGPGCGAASSAVTYDGNANVASRTDFAGNKTCYGNDLARNLETVRIEGLGAADACPATPAGYSPTATQRRISTEWHPLWRLKVREAQPKKITTWVYHGQPDPT